MEIAVSGTRFTSPRSPEIINSILDHYNPKKTIVRIGVCVGVDEEVAISAKGRGYFVRGYVPANRSQVAVHFEDFCDEVIYCPDGPEPYRIRNTMMVVEPTVIDRLYAIGLYPEHDPRSARSGTYMTVRIARKLFIPVTLYVLEGDGNE